MSEQWGTDAVISMPVPLDGSSGEMLDTGGFGVTEYGIAHNLTSSDLETFLSPTFRPLIGTQET